MMTASLSALAVIAAYLIGSIPFGLMIGKAVAGIDVRTVGSGNIGATNVGRTLGFRFFLLVFALDAAKGFLPTFFFARLVAQSVGQPVYDLPPFLALAAILGHNFPVYLGFKGGKGAATSLGAVFALDAAAGVGAVAGFCIVLVVTRMVSMGSIGGGLAFVGVHFLKVEDPIAPEHRAMTAMTLALMALLIYRHRKNLARIASGTEPRINFRKKRQPSGRVRVGLIAMIVAIAAGSGLAVNASRRPVLVAEGRRISEVARLATGHQRAERLAFVDGGKLLAITCPRYMRVVLASVGESSLDVVRDIELGGRPVAVVAAADRFYALQRPHGDARHLEEAWWESYDFAGKPLGPKVRVGWDPDDLALSPDGQFAYVITSGHAEGETNRPDPELSCYDLRADPPRRVGGVAFDRAKDDPERIKLLPDGRAAVSLRGSNQVVLLDLNQPASPRIVERLNLPSPCVPDSIAVDDAGRLIVGDPEASAYWRQSDTGFERVEVGGGVADLLDADGLVFATLPRGSGLAVLSAGSHETLGKFLIRGAANLATTRPLGLAYCRDRGLLAVSNRAGGSVHLIRIEPETDTRH